MKIGEGLGVGKRGSPSPGFTFLDKQLNPVRRIVINFKELPIRYSESLDALPKKRGISGCITNFVMLLAVKFYSQPCFYAVEIKDIRPDRMLPPKAKASLFMT